MTFKLVPIPEEHLQYIEYRLNGRGHLAMRKIIDFFAGTLPPNENIYTFIEPILTKCMDREAAEKIALLFEPKLGPEMAYDLLNDFDAMCKVKFCINNHFNPKRYDFYGKIMELITDLSEKHKKGVKTPPA